MGPCLALPWPASTGHKCSIFFMKQTPPVALSTLGLLFCSPLLPSCEEPESSDPVVVGFAQLRVLPLACSHKFLLLWSSCGKENTKECIWMHVLRTNTKSYAGFASRADRTGRSWDESLWATVAFTGGGFCLAQKQTQHIPVSNVSQMRTKASTWSRLRAQAAAHCSSCIINKGNVREGFTCSSQTSVWIPWDQKSEGGACCWGPILLWPEGHHGWLHPCSAGPLAPAILPLCCLLSLPTHCYCH